MNTNKTVCGCQKKQEIGKAKIKDTKEFVIKSIFLHLFILILWWLLYNNLKNFSHFLVYSVLNVAVNSKLGDSLEFFFYDLPKVFMLLTLAIYIVSMLRSYITAEKIRSILVGKNEFLGNIFAALFGIITPFCSCSAIPLFIGFVTSGVPMGVTFSFLISAPTVNEVALILLYGLLGWKIAAIYLGTGLFIAIFSGLIIGRLHPEKYLENWVKDVRSDPNKSSNLKMSWHERVNFAWDNTKDIFGRVWIYVIIGIAVGAVIHGYIPQDFLTLVMGAHSWWAVPFAVVLGIPLYSNASGMIPIVEALLGKGAALGTTLAFMMSVITLSFPEIVMLRRVVKMPFIYLFILTVTLGIMIVGYLFNWLI